MPRSTETTAPGAPLAARADWLALHDEAVIDPQQPIIDPHHHLWDRPGWPYGASEFIADTADGHQLEATVYVQCRTRYYESGPVALRPVGETADAAARAALAPAGLRLCAGIVGHADLLLGDAVQPVLEAHIATGAGRFRGIRHSTAWDADPQVLNPELGSAPHLMSDARFRAGIARLAPLGLSFDAWVYHPQLPEVLDLARAFPDTTIVLNHLGGPLGIGPYAQQREAVFSTWHTDIRALAACPNVRVKLGGLAMRISGRDFHLQDSPPDSTTLAATWQPWVEVCIDAFGAQRCMFESNFPVEKASCSYRVLWNAFKRLAASATAAERDALLRGTAARVYRLNE